MRRLVLACLAVTACSHKSFQYQPSGAELSALKARTAEGLLAMERGDRQTLTALTDSRGRGAILSVGSRLAVSKAPELTALKGSLYAAALLLGHTADRHPEKLAEREELVDHFVREELSALGDDVASDMLGPKVSLTSLTKKLVALHHDGDLEGDIARTAERRPAGCHFERSYVSYDLWLLRHVEWAEPESARVKEWKKDIRKLHLVEVQCGPPNEQPHGLMLFSQYEGASPQLVAWRFFDEQQWPHVTKRIDETLELKK